ncbi:MAG: hypothetical protein JJE04_05080, partial [Acidobacteriia bacterium]|nr:hypothetical protein [Terriglobia bacterium]
MMPRFARAVAAAGYAILSVSAMHAQRGGGDWMTIGNDPQRSHWVRSDGKISPVAMQKPGFEMVWKFKLKNEARQMNSLTPPVLLDFYISYRGFRTLGFLGGSSGTVTAIDTDLSRMEWEKPLGPASAGSGTALCPGGLTSSVTRPTTAAYPPQGGGRGRGSPAKSGVGEPFEGAVTLRPGPAQPPFPGPPPPAAGGVPNRRATPAPGPFSRTPLFLNVVSPDGKFHSMYVSNGEEPNPPVDFLPANANAVGLVVFDGSAYVATVNSCGGVADGVWGLDLESKKVSQWKAGAGVAGSAGAAAGPDGTLYVASGSELVALQGDTLQQ